MLTSINIDFKLQTKTPNEIISKLKSFSLNTTPLTFISNNNSQKFKDFAKS